MLSDRQHAEDAFQAVFLILARKAHSIRDADLLGNWLYGVALRTCRHARHQLDRRRKNEEAALMSIAASRVAAPSAEEVFLSCEQAELLHNEIERLPRAFRLPVVLCYLEGLTVHEAARRLRCSHGTLRSRMARAREKLKRGLTRRGVVLPATGVGRVPFHALRLGVGLIPPVRNHRACRDPVRRRPVRRTAGRGPGPGGAEIHAGDQAQTHRC